MSRMTNARWKFFTHLRLYLYMYRQKFRYVSLKFVPNIKHDIHTDTVAIQVRFRYISFPTSVYGNCCSILIQSLKIKSTMDTKKLIQIHKHKILHLLILVQLLVNS